MSGRDDAIGMSHGHGRKSVPWRKDPDILERLSKVEPLYHQKWSNRRIASALGVDEITIRRDIARLEELWLERHAATQEQTRARIVARFEDVVMRALAAAEFDERAERAVLLNEPMAGADGAPRQVYHDHDGKAQFRGNKAASLGVARAGIVDIAKTLGVYIEKQDLTHEAGASFLDALRGFGGSQPRPRSESGPPETTE